MPAYPINHLTMKPTRDQTFMEIAAVMAKRSTCTRGQVGAVIVRDRRIIATGYNGAPPGQPECIEVGCDELVMYKEPPGGIIAQGEDEYVEVSLGCQRAIHAEANAIAFAARHGVPVEGATMYCTHGPCLGCAKLMASAGIIRSVFQISYRDPAGYYLLLEMGIPCEQP